MSIREKGGLKELNPKFYTVSAGAVPNNEEVKVDVQSTASLTKTNSEEETKAPENKSSSQSGQ